MTLLSAGFLSARLNFCCSVYTLRLSSDSAPFRRGGADHTSGATTANDDPPASPLFFSTIAYQVRGGQRLFNGGLYCRSSTPRIFKQVSSRSERRSTSSGSRRGMRLERWMARRWISRGVTLGGGGGGGGGVTNDFSMYRYTPFPFSFDREFFIDFSSLSL